MIDFSMRWCTNSEKDTIGNLLAETKYCKFVGAVWIQVGMWQPKKVGGHGPPDPPVPPPMHIVKLFAPFKATLDPLQGFVQISVPFTIHVSIRNTFYVPQRIQFVLLKDY